MLIRAEVHPNAVWFLRFRCSREEQDEFYRVLDRLRLEPIANSEAYVDPEISPYVLRRFRFRNCFAIFEYDLSRNRIRITQCRRQPPQNRRNRD